MESFMSLSSQLIPDIDGRSIGHAVLCSCCLEIMSSWSDEWQTPQWGKMSWTGNRRSSRLMMLAVIICRCEWSQINHLGVRFELHWVKNGNDQTCGNGNRWALLKKKKKKKGENNNAVHAPWCVRSKSENMLVRGLRPLLTVIKVII